LNLIPDLIHRARESRHLFLHPRKPRWIVVNAMGYQVIELCRQGRSTQAIVAEIAARYHRPATTIYDDVVAFGEQLNRAGLLDDTSQPIAPERRPRVRRLTCYLTHRCNLQCRHCAVISAPHRENYLPLFQVQRLIDQWVASGGEAVIISGGEPLLHPDCLAILRYAATRIKTLLATNGALIDDPMAAALVDLGVAVQVSLDGATAATHDHIRGDGAFAKTWDGIERLQHRGIGNRLALSVTMMRANLDECRAVIDLAEARGVPAVRFFPLQRMGRAATEWNELQAENDRQVQLYEELYLRLPQASRAVVVEAGLPGFVLDSAGEEMWCGLGQTLAVDADGAAYPCSLLMEPSFRLGNVAETELGQLLASPRLQQIAAECAARKTQIAACRACDWRNFCQGGCSASVWRQRGTWWTTDDLCSVRQRLYEETIFSTAARPAI
jgi:radical SAM protein with 4Fe4S-binding SPASM domain